MITIAFFIWWYKRKLQFQPTAKLALVLCIALDKKFEDLFYF